MTVEEYLDRMTGTEQYMALSDVDKAKWIFMAQETLGDHFAPHQITSRAVAIQTLYALEGESEDFAMLKRQGVDTFTTEGLSVSFKSGAVSPLVIDIISRGGRAGVGSLI